MDYNFVTDRVAVGAALSSVADVAELLEREITHVVDCRSEFDDSSLFAEHGAVLLWIGVMDDGLPKPVSWFQEGIEFSLPVLAQPAKRVYFHCAAGVNRGPSMCYAVLRAWGLRPSQAENLIRMARPQVGLAYKGDADKAIVQLGYG